MALSVLIILTVFTGCYAVGTWKQCTVEKSDVLIDNTDEYTTCATWCPNMYNEPTAKGYCKSFPSGYFCQCRVEKNINTHQSCKVIDVSKVVDNADGLDTCEEWCRESEKSNTGTCLSYLSGYYCDCY